MLEEPLTENPIELKRNQARKAKEEREAERVKNSYTETLKKFEELKELLHNYLIKLFKNLGENPKEEHLDCPILMREIKNIERDMTNLHLLTFPMADVEKLKAFFDQLEVLLKNIKTTYDNFKSKKTTYPKMRFEILKFLRDADPDLEDIKYPDESQPLKTPSPQSVEIVDDRKSDSATPKSTKSKPGLREPHKLEPTTPPQTFTDFSQFQTEPIPKKSPEPIFERVSVSPPRVITE
jgi:hypothetical protein